MEVGTLRRSSGSEAGTLKAGIAWRVSLKKTVLARKQVNTYFAKTCHWSINGRERQENIGGGGEIEKDCLEPVPYSTVFKPAGSEAGIINEEQIIGPLPLRKKLTHIV